MDLSQMSLHELRKQIKILENRLYRTTRNANKAEQTYNELQILEKEYETRINKRNGFSFR